MDNACCFFGHKKITETEELKMQLRRILLKLITIEGVSIFYFGSRSQFDDLCYNIVTEIKKEQTHIQRIYVRAEYPVINDGYKMYLSKLYENSYYPQSVVGANRAVYVKRNQEMIRKSKYCIVYCVDDYIAQNRKSGTKLALDYAIKHNKMVYRLPQTN